MTSLAAATEELQFTHQVNNLKVQTANDLVIEYKCNGRGNYQRMDPGMSKQIKDYLNKSLVAFWVKNAGTFFLLDFETMQQFNVSTGFRRSIRYRGSCIPTQSAKRKRYDHILCREVDKRSRVESIDLTSSACAPIRATPQSNVNSVPLSLVAQPSASVGITPTISAEKNINHEPQIEVCGPAYKTAVRCGQVARRKLAQIRWLQLSRCKFVQDMRTLPQKQRLFNPDPIPEEDKRFPIEQVRHLERGGITVHEILPSVTWSRNRRYFNMLHEEEKQLYAGHGTSTNPAKIKHFAWHGAPAECIRGILEYGFLVGPAPRVGNRYGHGVYLSTEGYGRYSMNPTYSQPDVSGFRFMLLCEVLPGTVEASTSQQTRPSGLNVHSGVDQLPGASMHVFYTYDMNVRISPKYLVVIHPPVTDTIMSLVPNELQVAVAETNDPSDVVLIDCT